MLKQSVNRALFKTCVIKHNQINGDVVAHGWHKGPRLSAGTPFPATNIISIVHRYQSFRYTFLWVYPFRRPSKTDSIRIQIQVCLSTPTKLYRSKIRTVNIEQQQQKQTPLFCRFCENKTKKENILTHWSVAQNDSNDEKHRRPKILLDCPFKRWRRGTFSFGLLATN